MKHVLINRKLCGKASSSSSLLRKFLPEIYRLCDEQQHPERNVIKCVFIHTVFVVIKMELCKFSFVHRDKVFLRVDGKRDLHCEGKFTLRLKLLALSLFSSSSSSLVYRRDARQAP